MYIHIPIFYQVHETQLASSLIPIMLHLKLWNTWDCKEKKNNQPTNYPVSVGGRTFTQVTPPKQNWVSFFFVNNQIPRWYPVNNSVQTLGQNARNTLNNNTLTLQNEQSTTTYYNNLPKQPTLQQPTKTTYHNNLLVYYRPRDPTYTRESLRLFVSSRWGLNCHSFRAME